MWLCICLNNAGMWICDRLVEDADLGKKKIIFSNEAHFDLGGHVTEQNCRIWGTENPHASKSSHCLFIIPEKGFFEGDKIVIDK